MSDIVPFLAAIAAPAAARPFAGTLPVAHVPVGTSPWSPNPTPAPVAAAAPVVDVEAIKAAARDEGRREGLAETEALRAKLTALCAAVEAKIETETRVTSELVADAATAVMAAWVETVDKQQLFAPLVRSWLASSQAPATAFVHPADVGAMQAVVGDAGLGVAGDPGVARGDVVIRGATLELAHAWESRLRELRDGIAAALDAEA